MEDRRVGAWHAAVHWVTRVGHDLATEQQQQKFQQRCEAKKTHLLLVGVLNGINMGNIWHSLLKPNMHIPMYQQFHSPDTYLIEK